MTANSISTSMLNDMPVRTTELVEVPWFVGIDVIKHLGLDVHNVTNQCRNLDADESCTINWINVGLTGGAPLTQLSEAGVQKLIQRSDKPQAREFDCWVRHDVLPSIRRSGGCS